MVTDLVKASDIEPIAQQHFVFLNTPLDPEGGLMLQLCQRYGGRPFEVATDDPYMPNLGAIAFHYEQHARAFMGMFGGRYELVNLDEAPVDPTAS